jgi:thiamine pyrophosphate-dependent acetolactate synthase large subunit-like protein
MTAAKDFQRRAAIAAVLELLSDGDLVVQANGHISRDGYSCRKEAQDFYMIGSMGLAGSIGLGIALAEPAARVVVLDGDGNLLMGLGVLPMVGAWQPRCFLHAVFDNGTYASTGGQLTVSPTVDLAGAALACGYRRAAAVNTEAALRETAAAFLGQPGPSLLHVRVSSDEPPAQPRVDIEPPEIARRFAAAVRKLVQ